MRDGPLQLERSALRAARLRAARNTTRTFCLDIYWCNCAKGSEKRERMLETMLLPYKRATFTKSTSPRRERQCTL